MQNETNLSTQKKHGTQLFRKKFMKKKLIIVNKYLACIC